jgi:CBS domain-containing protein
MENLYRIFLSDIMVKNPYTININEPFSEVWEVFNTYNIRHLPVIDDNKVLRGLVTQRDLYRIASPRKTIEGELLYDKMDLDQYILERVMIKEVHTLSAHHTLKDAIDLLTTTKYGCIPIVDDNKHLVGIITPLEVLKAVAECFI